MGNNRDVIVKLRLAGEDFDRDFKVKMQDLTEAAEQASANSGTKAGGLWGAAFAGAAGAAGAAIGLAISNAADRATEILNTSRQLNIGAQALQIWQQAALRAKIGSEEFGDTLTDLTSKIGEAVAGNKAAQQAFVDLGIGFETTSGEARATDAVLLDLADTIANAEDPATRLRLGTALLGDEFKNIYPLLINGADGFNKFAAEASAFGTVLTQQELQDLDGLNKDIEEMHDQLSRRVDKSIAQNADAIRGLTGDLYGFADAAVKAAGDAYYLYNQLQSLKNYDPSKIEPDRYDPNGADAKALRRMLGPTAQGVAPPRVTGGGRPRGGGGGGRPRTPTQSAAEKEAERAAKEAIRNEEQLRASVEKTAQAQRDNAQIARIRATQGEVAAAMAKAELDYMRQGPAFQAKTVEELGKALGYTEEGLKTRRQELQTILAIVQANRENAKTQAATNAWGNVLADAAKRYNDAQEKMKRDTDKAADDFRLRYTSAVTDVANIYESLFRGGTKDLWRNFKDEGTRIISEIAAQWTLALIAGQPFNFNQAASGAFGRSPLSSLFFGSAGPFGAANDNGLAGAGGVGNIFTGIGGAPGIASYLPRSGGGLAGAAARATLGVGGSRSFLQQPGFALGLGALTTSLVGGGQASQLGGMVGSIGGQALGSSIAALGSFGGPVGAIAGALLGSFLPKVLASPKRASVTVGNNGGVLGITGSQGNSAARRETATQGAGSLIDAIFQIADQLGGSVDPTRGAVSFGMRKSSFRVDPTGRGITKVGNGAVDFGSDQEGAMRYAISDLIKDGVITGISQASQNLLQKGGDLDKQVEKALLIEQIPKLLRQRFDPLGAALDDIFDKFKRVNEALIEGSASAEQFAQARQLWELEKADAIASVGAASQSLKDFLAALNAGSSSPLSLREQRAEAERQLQPFLAQINAAEAARAEVDRLRTSGASAADIAAAEARARTTAAAINQDGFTNASQLLLSISRQTDASSAGYFADFDRIRALTGQAIGFVDQATARGADSRDPFARETAQNTRDTALILSDLSAESRAQGETLRQIAAALSAGGVSGFVGERRAFAA